MAQASGHGDAATFVAYRDKFHKVIGRDFQRPVLIETNAHEGPVYVGRDVYARHQYRKENPCPGSHVHKVYNVSFSLSSVFSERTYNNHFHQWCWTRGGIDRRKIEALEKQGRAGVNRPWTVEEEEELLKAIPKLDHPDGKHEKNPIPLKAIYLARERMRTIRRTAKRLRDPQRHKMIVTAPNKAGGTNAPVGSHTAT